MKVFLSLLCLLMIISSCTGNDNTGGKIKWENTERISHDSLPWIPFSWAGDSIGKRYYDKLAMNVNVDIAGLPKGIYCQFDLGCNLSLLYGNPIQPSLKKGNALFDKFRRNKKWLILNDTKGHFEKLQIDMGKQSVFMPYTFIYDNYGDSESERIGTIGVDIFRDKVLIIDYPNKRFCAIDSVPPDFKGSLSEIEINKNGKVILPMKLNGKTIKVMFDNGSSIFPIIVTDANTQEFAKARNTDSLPISSWGIMHTVTGRKLEGRLEFAGADYGGIMVYTDHRKQAKEDYLQDGIDAITGNALFWNKTIMIDFKRKKFGIKSAR